MCKSSPRSLTAEDDTVIDTADGRAPGTCVDIENLFYDYNTGAQVVSLTAGDYTDVVILVQ